MSDSPMKVLIEIKAEITEIKQMLEAMAKPRTEQGGVLAGASIIICI